MRDEKNIWRHLGEGLAAVGVIASLIFVALEVRQNTEAVKGATVQALSQQSMELTVAGFDNADLRVALATARDSTSDSLSTEQWDLLRWYFSAMLRVSENRFRQIQIGILDPSSLGQFGGGRSIYRTPVFLEFWSESAPEYSEDFRLYVDETLLPWALNQGEHNP